MSRLKKILEISAALLKDPIFIAQHRLNPAAFVHRRKLPFEVIAGTLIHLIKNSSQIVCNWLGDFFKMDQAASKQAFSKARMNLSHTCFQDLIDHALEEYYSQDREGVWKGFRVFAVDGSLLRLPESEDTLAHFGRWERGGDNRSNTCPVMGRISEITDMTSGIIVAACLLPWTVGEQHIAEGQVKQVVEKFRSWEEKGLLFVYDRGYPSKEFFNLHSQLKADFLFRIPRSFNQRIDALVAEGKQDAIEDLYEGTLFRILVLKLPSGEQEVLLSSLIDQDRYPYESIFALYQARWSAMEEGYKRQKIALELQNWATKTTLGVLQEYWATIFISNVVAVGCVELEGYTIPEQRLSYRINRSVVFGSLRKDVLGTITGKITAEQFEKKFKKIATRAKIPIRPGRSYTREGMGKPKRFLPLPRVC
jgi:hypothetical protein